MRRGFIPLDVHAAIEPIAAILLIAGPWIFGFSDVHSATVVSVGVGVVMLLSGAMTQWRLALVRVIPLRMHFMTDLVLGAVLIVVPFIFGFSGSGGPTRFMIIMGALELVTALSTRWEPLAEPDARRRSGLSTAR